MSSQGVVERLFHADPLTLVDRGPEETARRRISIHRLHQELTSGTLVDQNGQHPTNLSRNC